MDLLKDPLLEYVFQEVLQGVTSVHAYFPEDVWYSLVPETYAARMDIGYVDVEARLDSLTPVYARGCFKSPYTISENVLFYKSIVVPLD